MGQVEIEDKVGVKAIIQGVSKNEEDVIARMSEGTLIQIPVHLLRILNQKSYKFDGIFSDIHQESHERESVASASAENRFYVVEENPLIRKKRVETGEVKVKKSVSEKMKSVSVPLQSEEVVIERVPVDQVFDSAQSNRQEGDTWIIPVQEEILVVEKKVLVREEVRISTRKSIQEKEVLMSLRSEEIRIDRKGLKEN